MKGKIIFKRKKLDNQHRAEGLCQKLPPALATLIGLVLTIAIAAGASNLILRSEPLHAASIGSFGNLTPPTIPAVLAPHGIDEGNKFLTQSIAQSSTGGGGTSAGAIYDPLRRIVKIVETRNGSVTSTKQFLWAGDRLCEERDGNGNVTKRFFDLGEQISGTNYYYTRDHLDSVREMTDGSGNIVAQYSYDPYGRATKLQGSLESDFQFAGLYMHEPSGLNLALNRAYSPSFGRFISRDPIDDPTFAATPQTPEPPNPDALFARSMVSLDPLAAVPPIARAQVWRFMPVPPAPSILGGQTLDPNRYAYVSNNPVNLTDPTGLQPSGPGWRPVCGWPDEWFKCAAKCAAKCALVKNKGFCFQECYRACIHGMDP